MPPHRIDTHHHYFSPRFIREMRDQILKEIGGAVQIMEGWTPARAVEMLDEGGIATAILALCNPGPWRGDAGLSCLLAQDCNEFAASVAADYPGRFGNFATLPLPDIEGSLKEVAFAFDTLKADGILLHSNEQDRHLGDPSFAPLYEELNRRKAVIFVHPTTPSCCRNLMSGVGIPDGILEFPFDTTRTITSLLFSGTLHRFPDIRWIFAHCGGALPMVLERLELVAMRYNVETQKYFPQGVAAEVRKLYFDPITQMDGPGFASLMKMVPPTQILYGTDSPIYHRVPVVNEQLGRLDLTPDQLHAIERGNSLALFPQFAP